MAMFERIVGGVLGQLGGAQQGPLMQVVQGQPGGLSGPPQKFQAAGLRQQAPSGGGSAASRSAEVLLRLRADQRNAALA